MEKIIETELIQIDKVLKYFKGCHEKGGLMFDEIVKYFDPDHKLNFGHDLIAILEKLDRDKMIFKMSNEHYHITLEGKLFGGYLHDKLSSVEKEKELERRESRLEEREIKNASQTKSLTYATWVLALFTLLLFIATLITVFSKQCQS